MYKNKDWLILQRDSGKTMKQVGEICKVSKHTIQKWSRLLDVRFYNKNNSLDKPRKDFKDYKVGTLILGNFIKYMQHGSSRAALYEYKCNCGFEGTNLLHIILKKKMCPKCGMKKAGERKRKHNDTMYIALTTYKSDARRRRLEWHLTEEQFRSITSSKCFYCGRKPSNIKRISENRFNLTEYVYNGIDRKDNNKHYTLDNAVPCCSKCNLAKRNMKFEDFIEWLDDLVKFRTNYLSENQ